MAYMYACCLTMYCEELLMLSGDLPQSYWNWFSHSQHMLREEKKQMPRNQLINRHTLCWPPI